jgi:uncharacterized protein YgfB (UPF0149 family)
MTHGVFTGMLCGGQYNEKVEIWQSMVCEVCENDKN